VRLGLRQRVALWCAALVVVSGVSVVVLVVVLSGRFLAQENRPSKLGLRPEQIGAPPGSAAAPSGPVAGGVDPNAARGGPTAAQGAQRAAADRTFERVRNLGLATVAGLMLASLLVAWAVAGRIVRPIKQVTETARSIGRDRKLDRRIAYDGPQDEIHDLADEFDTMLGRLEAVFDAQREFVANASHELRTPLAVIRTEVDVALDDPDASDTDLRGALHAVGDVVERTSGLVTAMLALSRAEVISEPRTVDLADVARAATYAERVRNGNRSFSSDLEPAPVAGDPVLLGQLVENLVRNAVTYNRDGGSVAVRIRSTGGTVQLVVENDGPPVDPRLIPSLFERFVRRTPVGDGHGLGLAICATIARTHGGTIRAAPGERGGLAVTVELPAVEGTTRAEHALVGAAAPDGTSSSGAAPDHGAGSTVSARRR